MKMYMLGGFCVFIVSHFHISHDMQKKNNQKKPACALFFAVFWNARVCVCVHEIAIHTAKISAHLSQREAFIDLYFYPYSLSVTHTYMDLLDHVKATFPAFND